MNIVQYTPQSKLPPPTVHSAARRIPCGGGGDRAALQAAFSCYTFVNLLTFATEGQSEHKQLSEMAACIGCHLVKVLLLISNYAVKISLGERPSIKLGGSSMNLGLLIIHLLKFI